ncbi:tape measure protein [Pragia fontium]|uniref:tape measure protein n=1 Tax=Pragia fontium TaxID=82985 RepID=UPI00130ECF93|nr:tape measure protein [Pragia fontium]
MRQNNQSLRQLNAQLNSVRASAIGAMAVLGGGLAISSIIKTSDDWGQMENRLMRVAGSAQEYNKTLQSLMVTSDTSYRSLTDSAELYIRSATAMKEMGYSTQNTLGFIDSLSNSFTLNSAAADKTVSAIDAISKGMVTGTVASKQWVTITTAIPSVIGDIAKYLNTTETAVSKMAMTGQLSMKVFADAVIAAKDENVKLANEMPNTLGDALTRLTNHWQVYTSEMNKAHGVTAGLVDGLGFITNNLNAISTAGMAVVGGGIVRYLVNMGVNAGTAATGLLNAKKSQIALASAQVTAGRASLIQASAEVSRRTAALAAAQGALQQAAAETALEKAQQRRIATVNALAAAQARLNTSTSLLSSTMGLLGGPAGIAAMAATGIFYFAQKSAEAERNALALKDGVKLLTSDIEKMNEVTRDSAIAKKTEEIKDQEDQIDSARTKLKSYHLELQMAAQVNAGEIDSSPFVRADTEAIERDIKKQREVIQGLVEGLNKATHEQNMLTNSAYRAGVALQEMVSDISVAADEAQKLTDNFENLDKSINSTTLQIDVADLASKGLAEQAFVLAGLQKAAGDAALKHRADLIALAQGGAIAGEMTDELATKLRDHAAQFRNLFKLNQEKPKKTKVSGGGGNKQEQSFERQNAQMLQQIALYGQTSELAKIKYQLSQGELKSLDAAKKAVLERNATELDKLNAQREFNTLIENLRTPEERLLATTKERLQVLKDANLSADEYQKALEKVSKASIADAPTFGGLSPEIGGAAGEMINIAKAEAELQAWHDKQIEMQDALFAEKEIGAAEHASRLNEIEATSAQKRGEIQSAYAAAALGTISSMTGSMADMMAQMGDKSSAAYKTMFLASKAASIAQAMISTEVAAAKALEMGPILGIPAASIVRGLGYASVGMIAGQAIAGMAHDGIDNVPREGTWLLDRGERVVDARTNADLKNFLSNTGGNKGGNSLTINVPVDANGGVSEQDAKALGNLIKSHVNDILTKERRPGGLLSKG